MWRSGRTPGGHPLDTGVGPPSQTGSSCREPTSVVMYTGGATRPLRANFSEADERMGPTSLRVSAMLVMWVLRVRSSTVLGRSDAGRHDVLCADPSSVRQEPAGRAAPVDRARQPTPMLPPGDPELAARRCSSLPPWGRDLVHRLAPGGLPVGVGAAYLPDLCCCSISILFSAGLGSCRRDSREPGQPRQVGLLLQRGDPLVGGQLGSDQRHGVAPGPTSTRPFMPRCSVQEYR
jgi:hypothetical protein